MQSKKDLLVYLANREIYTQLCRDDADQDALWEATEMACAETESIDSELVLYEFTFDLVQLPFMTSLGVLDMQLRPEIISDRFTGQIAFCFEVLHHDVATRQSSGKLITRLKSFNLHLHPPATSRTSARHPVLISTVASDETIHICDSYSSVE